MMEMFGKTYYGKQKRHFASFKSLGWKYEIYVLPTCITDYELQSQLAFLWHREHPFYAWDFSANRLWKPIVYNFTSCQAFQSCFYWLHKGPGFLSMKEVATLILKSDDCQITSPRYKSTVVMVMLSPMTCPEILYSYNCVRQ